MGRRALGIGLGLLTVALWVGPIVAAFASNGWSLKETVMPNQEGLSAVRGEMKGVQSGFKQSKMSFGNLENEDGKTSLTVNYKSAFSVPVKIKKLVLAFSDDGLLQMEQDEVEVQPQENVPIVLSGQVSGVSRSELENAEVSAEFEVWGATIAFAGGVQRG